MRNSIFGTTGGGAGLLAAAGLAGMLFTGTAKAADRATPVYNWTGFYVGANGGYAWHDRSDLFSVNDILAAGFFSSSAPPNTPIPPANFDVKGGFGGFQLGYDWQVTPNWIVGLEADLQFGDIKGTGTANHISVTLPAAATVSETIKWFGTARARLGYLVAKEFLVYGTGGFAYGRVEQAANWTFSGTNIFGDGGFGVICTAGVPCYAGSSSTIETGWTVGAGAEWAVWNNVTFKAEYLYVNLGPKSVTMVGSVLPPGNFAQSSVNVTGDIDFHSVRAGLNFKF